MHDNMKSRHEEQRNDNTSNYLQTTRRRMFFRRSAVSTGHAVDVIRPSVGTGNSTRSLSTSCRHGHFVHSTTCRASFAFTVFQWLNLTSIRQYSQFRDIFFAFCLVRSCYFNNVMSPHVRPPLHKQQSSKIIHCIRNTSFGVQLSIIWNNGHC